MVLGKKWLDISGRSCSYAILNVVNGLIKNDFSFSCSKLGIAAGAFLLGELLLHTYKPTLRVKKKYHLQPIKISN